MKISKKLRLQLQIQKCIFVGLLLTIAGLLAWVSHEVSFQYDWTSNNRNTLSQGSIDLLQSMTDPITINVYMQDDPTIKAAVEEILKRYQRVSRNFNYHMVNPDIDIEQAQQDGIKQYGQIVVKYQGRKEVILSLSEQAISSALQRLSRSQKINLVFLKGHGERDPAGTANISYSELAAKLFTKGIVIKTHNLLEAALPADTSVLVIAAPSKPYLAGELNHVITFIKNGGNLLWMMDPGELQGLDDLANYLGVEFMGGIIVDNNINLRETLRIKHPAIIPVLDYHQHAITKNLSYNTLFPISRGIKPIENSDWLPSIIAQSLPHSWLETSGITKDIVFNSASGDVSGPVAIILALERSITDNKNLPVKASQRIVVTGDSDFLANNYLGSGANMNLGLNIIDWLSGDDDLIAVDIKNAPDTQLVLNDDQVLVIGIGFFLALPAGLLLTGFLIWFKRRKR